MKNKDVKKVETKSPKLEPAEYNSLVAHARVQAIRLINAKYEMKPAALSGNRERWIYQVSNRLLDWHCDNEALLLSGTWEYTASCVEGRRKLLTVMGKYLVTYRLNAICDPDAGQQFYERVAKFAAYPYFRSTFAMLTQQSGIELHPLPVMSEQPRWVTPPTDPKKEKKSSEQQKPSRAKAGRQSQ